MCEMLSPFWRDTVSYLGDTVSYFIWAMQSPNFGETQSPEQGEFQLKKQNQNRRIQLLLLTLPVLMALLSLSEFVPPPPPWDLKNPSLYTTKISAGGGGDLKPTEADFLQRLPIAELELLLAVKERIL